MNNQLIPLSIYLKIKRFREEKLPTLKCYYYTPLSTDLLRGIYYYGFDIPPLAHEKLIPPLINKRNVIIETEQRNEVPTAYCIAV